MKSKNYTLETLGDIENRVRISLDELKSKKATAESLIGRLNHIKIQLERVTERISLEHDSF